MTIDIRDIATFRLGTWIVFVFTEASPGRVAANPFEYAQAVRTDHPRGNDAA
jgi:hypothetical protein